MSQDEIGRHPPQWVLLLGGRRERSEKEKKNPVRNGNGLRSPVVTCRNKRDTPSSNPPPAPYDQMTSKNTRSVTSPKHMHQATPTLSQASLGQCQGYVRTEPPLCSRSILAAVVARSVRTSTPRPASLPLPHTTHYTAYTRTLASVAWHVNEPPFLAGTNTASISLTVESRGGSQ